MLKRLLGAALRPSRARSAPAQAPQAAALARSALEAQRLGDVTRAEALLRQWIAAAPDAAAPHAMLAELLRAQGRDGEARAEYERAVALEPQPPELLLGYAQLLAGLGDRPAAAKLYAAIADERPDWALPYLRWGGLALDATEWDRAADLFGRAAALDVANVQARIGLAIAHLNLRRLTAAIAAARAALAVEPENATALDLLAAAYRTLGDADALRDTLSRRHFDGAVIAASLALPAFLDSETHIASVRSRLAEDVTRLLETNLTVTDPPAEIGATTFYLAYHGKNDRHLQERVAALHLHACPDLAFVADHCRSRSDRQADRIRIGILSSCLHEHSVARVMHGLIAQLDRSRFSVHLFACQTAYDARSRALETSADEWVMVPRELRAARERIASAGLDVVLYPEIGMDAFTYALAFARLAPVQCTTWGHPVTTGIPAIDYFISTDYFEPNDAAAHYRERLVQLSDVAFPGYYFRPESADVPVEGDVGFDKNRPVYLCPQRLFKMHPAFDRLIGDILRRDRGGQVVFVHDPEEDAWRLPRLKARLERNCAAVYDRIAFLEKTPTYSGYLQRMQQCAVVLDTIHYCGGNTSLEAISAGALVVTLPSGLNRGRHTYGFLRKMGFMDTIAIDADDYVEKAVRIATDRDLRMALKETQAARSDALYEDTSAVRQMEDFFAAAVAAAA